MHNPIKGLPLLAIATVLAACAGDHKKPGTTAAQTKAVPKQAAKSPRPSLEEFVFPEPLPWGQRTVDDVLYAYAPYAVSQLKPYFAKAGVAYPPRELTLVGLKEEKKLEVWARDHGEFRFIRAYDIKAASGKHGPKLRQGDKQVPEGIYRIVRLNPNSNYHLSLKLNYPNEFDRFHAAREGRMEPGSDIYIHGDSVSAGCLAMGDAAIEELFVLAAHVGPENITVIIAPRDPRNRALDPHEPGLPSWTGELYQEISSQILALAPAEPVKVSTNPPAAGPDRKIR